MRFNWSTLRHLLNFPVQKQLAKTQGPEGAGAAGTTDGGLRIPRHLAVIMDGNGRWA